MTAEGLDWAQLDGSLVLVTPREYIPSMETAFGATSAVRADVTVLDGSHAEEEHLDTLIFPKVLQAQVRPSIDSGGMVLGRLGHGTAKEGQLAPWTLASATEADKKIGRWHLAKSADQPF